MAEFDNSAIVGAKEVRAAGTQGDLSTVLGRLQQYDSGVGNVGHDRLHQFPASFISMSQTLPQVGISAAMSSVDVEMPFPVRLFRADLGIVIGGATVTIDVEVAPAAAPTTFASILDAAEDVKAVEGSCVSVAPEDGSEELAYGDRLRFVCTNGITTACDGAVAHFWMQRL